MNRRRAGLAALIIGAGAAVRQRLKKRQNDPGPDVTFDAVTSDRAIPDAVVDRAQDAGSATVESSPSARSSNAPDAAISLGDPEIDVAVESTLGDPEIDTTAQLPTAAVVEIDVSSADSVVDIPGVDIPGVDIPGVDVPVAQVAVVDVPALDLPVVDIPAPDAPVFEAPSAVIGSDGIPKIVLPTLSSAGTNAVAASEIATKPEIAPTAPLPLPTESDSKRLATPAAVSAAPVAGFAEPASSSSVATRDATTSAPNTSEQQAAAVADVAQMDTPAEKEPFHRAHRAWSIFGGIMLGLAVVVLIAAAVVPLPYYSLQPGSVYDTIERVEAPGELVSIPEGEIGFVTVSQTANITALQWLDAKLDSNVRIRHEDEVRGDQTADELRAADIRRMTVSKNSAVVVALQKLGFDLVITPIGIEVAQVFDCTAADGALGTGDLIVGVNGVEVLTGEQLVAELMDQSVGAEVDLLIERIDPTNPTQSMRTDLVALTLGSADAACLSDDVRADEPRPFIGIGTLPVFDEEFPIDIDVRTGTISGPSAGLAFTLAIMDVLSEGELTNGLSVVATGSIDRDGNVGPVGGIHQKTVAAERSGADVFIVPRCCENFVDRTTGEPLDIPGNYEEALLYADDIIVIGVDTLDEALIALGELGGDVEDFLPQEAP